MVQEAQRVRHWLMSNRNISVPDDWLEACIEWIHSESEVINVCIIIIIMLDVTKS